jgi:putative cell wall-binding protein
MRLSRVYAIHMSAARRLRIVIFAAVLAVGGVVIAATSAPAAGEAVTLSAVPGTASRDTEAVAGKVTLAEAQPNTQFTAAHRTVTLTINQIGDSSADAELVGPAPSVTASAGHSVDPASVVITSETIQFVVDTDAANSTAATISVTGIHLHTHGYGQVRIASDVTSGDVKFLNVVDQSRIAGDDRYETSAKVVANLPRGGDEHTQAIVLASGENFPDALSAINCCSTADYPAVLLTRPDSLADSTRKAIIDSRALTVYIAGSSDVISRHVESQVRALHRTESPQTLTVERFAGDDRYDTNSLLLRNGAVGGNVALLASGLDFADGLALGPVSRALHAPLILTNGQSLTDVQTSLFAHFHTKTVVIAGGTASVSSHVEDQLRDLGLTVERVSGQDRVETAANIARWETEGLKNPNGTPVFGFLGTSLGFSSSPAYVANGSGFADALSFGQLAGDHTVPLLLSHSSTTPGEALTTYVGGKTILNALTHDSLVNVVAAGGDSVVSPALVDRVATAVQQ